MPDYELLERKKNMIVGAFVIIGSMAFIWLVFVFGEMPLAVNRLRSYSIYVHFDSIIGVQKNTPVQYCGYQIGRVATVAPPRTFEKDGRTQCRITLELLIDKKFSALPDTVSFNLIKRGLGSAYIDLKPNPSLPITGVISPNNEYVGRVASFNEFLPQDMQDRITKMIESITSLSDHADLIVGDEMNRENIKQTLENFAQLTQDAQSAIDSIRDMSDRARVTFTNADEDFSQISDAIIALSEQTNATLAQIQVSMEKINNGQGSVSRFLNDPRLYESLLDSTYELQMVLKDLQALSKQTREQGLKIKL